ncbi:MAG: hypothetical protein ABR905_22410 [Terracidiphilus sp.]
MTILPHIAHAIVWNGDVATRHEADYRQNNVGMQTRNQVTESECKGNAPKKA